MENNSVGNGNIDSLRIMAMLLKKKYLIIITVVLATAASVIISLNLPLWYKSTVNVVPPKGEGSSSSGSIGAALKNFGLKQLGGGGGTPGSYDYIVMLYSRTVADSIIKKYNLPEVYEIPAEEMTAVRKVFSGNVYIGYEESGNYLVSVWDQDPQRAADMANDIIHYANMTAVRVVREEARLNTEHLESRYDYISNRLKTVQDSLRIFSKEYLMFAPEQQAQSITEALAEMKLQVMQYETAYIIYKERFGETDPKTLEIKAILDETKNKIHEAQTEPGFAGNFSVDEAAGIGIDYVDMMADLEALTQMKSLLLPMIEEAKYDEVKKIQNLYVVDEAIPADKKDKPKRSLIVAGTFFGSFVLIVFLILVFNAIKEFNAKLKKIEE